MTPSLGSITCHVLKQGVPPKSGFHSRPCSMSSGVWHHAAGGDGKDNEGLPQGAATRSGTHIDLMTLWLIGIRGGNSFGGPRPVKSSDGQHQKGNHDARRSKLIPATSKVVDRFHSGWSRNLKMQILDSVMVYEAELGSHDRNLFIMVTINILTVSGRRKEYPQFPSINYQAASQRLGKTSRH